MIRTQIQLTDEQSKILKKLATQHKTSVAQLIRHGIDTLIRSHAQMNRAEQKRRAQEITGQFRSDQPDLADKHDDHLADSYSQ